MTFSEAERKETGIIIKKENSLSHVYIMLLNQLIIEWSCLHFTQDKGLPDDVNVLCNFW